MGPRTGGGGGGRFGGGTGAGGGGTEAGFGTAEGPEDAEPAVSAAARLASTAAMDAASALRGPRAFFAGGGLPSAAPAVLTALDAGAGEEGAALGAARFLCLTPPRWPRRGAAAEPLPNFAGGGPLELRGSRGGATGASPLPLASGGAGNARTAARAVRARTRFAAARRRLASGPGR